MLSEVVACGLVSPCRLSAMGNTLCLTLHLGSDGSGCRLSAIGDFHSNFSRGVVRASDLLGKPELVSQSLDC